MESYMLQPAQQAASSHTTDDATTANLSPAAVRQPAKAPVTEESPQRRSHRQLAAVQIADLASEEARRSPDVLVVNRRGRGRPKKQEKPSGLLFDSSGRPYQMVKGKWGELELGHGVLLPSNYEKTKGTGLPWVCPIRSCRLAFMKITTIGRHWKRSHYNCLLNDNMDGTFSITGQYKPKKRRTAASVVVSRRPLDSNEPPMQPARSYAQLSRVPMVGTSKLAPEAPPAEASDDEEVLVDPVEQAGPNDDDKDIYQAASPLRDASSSPADPDWVEVVDFKSLPVYSKHNVPDELLIATPDRSYREWVWTGTLSHSHECLPGSEVQRHGGYGSLLPAKYKFSDDPALRWNCPVRSCPPSVRFGTISGLGAHFNNTHRRTLFHDNDDGTLSIIGLVDFKPDSKSAMVISRGSRRKSRHSDNLTGVEQKTHSNQHRQPAKAQPAKPARIVIKHKDKKPEHNSVQLFTKSSNALKKATTISEDTGMATKIRGYYAWPGYQHSPDKSHKLVLLPTRGLPLPAGYQLAMFPGFEWICPVRSCRKMFQSIMSLAGHFTYQHRACLLNDNRDGTLSITESYSSFEAGKIGRPAMITSKNALSDNAPAMAMPQRSIGNGNFTRVFEASQAKLQDAGHQRLRAQILDSGRDKPPSWYYTLGGVSYELDMDFQDVLVAAERDNSDSSALSSPLPTPELDRDFFSAGASPSPSRQGSEEVDGMEPGRIELLDEGGNNAELPFKDATARENWAYIRPHLRLRKDIPPIGHYADLLSRPRVRDMEWNTQPRPHLGNSLRRAVYKDKNPKDVACLILQITGEKAPQPCNHCAKGAGIFQGCVAVDQRSADEMQSGRVSCVNCAYKSARVHKSNSTTIREPCDLARLLRANAGGAGARREAHGETGVEGAGSERHASGRRSGRLVVKESVVAAEKGGVLFPNLRSRAATVVEEVAFDGEDDELPADEDDELELRPEALDPIDSETTTHRTIADGRFSFSINVVPAASTHPFEPDYERVRICSLVAGKLMVRLDGEPEFIIGHHGMFKLLPGAGGFVVNGLGVDAVLHVSSVGSLTAR